MVATRVPMTMHELAQLFRLEVVNAGGERRIDFAYRRLLPIEAARIAALLIAAASCPCPGSDLAKCAAALNVEGGAR